MSDDNASSDREHGQADSYRGSKRWCVGCEEFVPGGEFDRHSADGQCGHKLGWFAPDEENSDEWGAVLAALEEAGFDVSERRGGQLLSRRSFEIYREQDTECSQSGGKNQ